MKKEMNNKGFSLVELIIVIAIMAILVVVLAPQYLKYVEKSRESADLDNYQAIISAIEIYNSDPSNESVTSLGISENQNINKKNKDLENYYRIMFKIPGISIFSLIAFYNLILIYMLVHSFYKKIYSLWIIAVPLIISILVVIAGPLVHPRYLFPIIYSLPIVLSFYLYVMGKKLNYVDFNTSTMKVCGLNFLKKYFIINLS